MIGFGSRRAAPGRPRTPLCWSSCSMPRRTRRRLPGVSRSTWRRSRSSTRSADGCWSGCSVAPGSGADAQFIDLPPHYRGLIEAIGRVNLQKPALRPAPNRLWGALETLGRATVQLGADGAAFIDMLGRLAAAIARVIAHPRRFRLTSAVYHLFRVGWQAAPIMVLITFLIGAIIAQQGIFHFRKFGADAYVVDMVGILVLREIGVLIVSIMSAG